MSNHIALDASQVSILYVYHVDFAPDIDKVGLHVANLSRTDLNSNQTGSEQYFYKTNNSCKRGQFQ